jgi:hypothetical protein
MPLHLSTVIRQEQRPAAKVIDWNLHGQFSGLVGSSLLDEVRNPPIRLNGDLGHGIFPQVQGALVPGIFWNTFRHRTWRSAANYVGFSRLA